jgi:hypothetical protein
MCLIWITLRKVFPVGFQTICACEPIWHRSYKIDKIVLIIKICLQLTLLYLAKEKSGLVHFVPLLLKKVIKIINYFKISIPPFACLVSIMVFFIKMMHSV